MIPEIAILHGLGDCMTGEKKVRNIADLAKLAGVSAGTVSRALGDSPLIALKTRERIQGMAREHGFRPNILARNLRTRRTGAVGVLIPLGHERTQHLSDPFFMAMLGCIADALAERSYDLLLSRVTPVDPDWLSFTVQSGRVDGIILIGQSDQMGVIEEQAKLYPGMVVWGAHIDGQQQCTVGSNNRKGGALAAQHLIDQGCRNIAFLGDPTAPEIGDRLEGATTVLSAIKGATLETLPVHLTADRAYEAIGAWLDAQETLPDGIFAASDLIAMSVLRALSERKIDVPGKLRIVGYDNLDFARHTVPPLTTVHQDIRMGANHLVDLLFRRMAGEATDSVIMEPKLVIREST